MGEDRIDSWASNFLIHAQAFRILLVVHFVDLCTRTFFYVFEQNREQGTDHLQQAVWKQLAELLLKLVKLHQR